MKVEDAIRLVAAGESISGRVGDLGPGSRHRAAAAERGVDEDTLKRVAKVEAFEPADAVRPKRMTLSDLSGPWGEEPFELQGAAAEMVPDRSVWRPEVRVHASRCPQAGACGPLTRAGIRAQRMKERWGGCKVDVGGESRIEVFLDSFLDYADRIETKYSVADPAEEDPDASPLYVFDPRFIEALPGVEEGYRVLPPLAMDLADAVYKGHDDQREDHKWLLIGPHGTGYGMHRDPASTSSWNLLIHGRKHWILLPPHVPQDVVLPPDCGPIVQRSATAWMHHVRRRAYQRAKEEVRLPPARFLAPAPCTLAPRPVAGMAVDGVRAGSRQPRLRARGLVAHRPQRGPLRRGHAQLHVRAHLRQGPARLHGQPGARLRVRNVGALGAGDAGGRAAVD